MPPYDIRPVEDRDRKWMTRFLESRWGSARIITRGRIHEAAALPGFVAEMRGQPVGLITYRTEASDAEIITLDSLTEGLGIGTALMTAVVMALTAEGMRRLWLITTNDNTPALKFYQKQGFSLCALHHRAIEESRKLKPEIPASGMDGIPIRDEIELELML
jgi:ribosomal protein S18 acetylase RimI-like enzyme